MYAAPLRHPCTHLRSHEHILRQSAWTHKLGSLKKHLSYFVVYLYDIRIYSHEMHAQYTRSTALNRVWSNHSHSYHVQVCGMG